MKTIIISLNGQDRTLDVGKFYFTKFLGEAIGEDPLNAKVDQFDWVVGIVYAGMMTDCKTNKKDPDFTKADIEGWIGGLEIEDVTGIINKYLEVTGGEKPGEPLTQA